jgi:AGCS family alanine or glycine:cation symporter
LQSNTMAEVLQEINIPPCVTGLFFAIIVFIMLRGGAQRIGRLSAALVPVMFILYVLFSVWIIVLNYHNIIPSFTQIINGVLQPTAAVGGFVGVSLYATLRAGIYKGVFITEAGMGTSAIPHAMADTQKPSDQGVLAMCSVFAEALVCMLSGMLVLVTEAWHVGGVSTTLVYRIFNAHFPLVGSYVLIASLFLFAIGTIIGNSFNGGQSFASLTGYRGIIWYQIIVSIVIFGGAIMQVPLAWAIMEVILPFIAVPHLIGLVILAFRYKKVLER